jgi:hypothetical protein
MGNSAGRTEGAPEVTTLKGLAEKMARDARALTDLAAKGARPLGYDPVNLPCPEVPDVPAVREVPPLVEQLAELIKPAGGTPGHTPERRGRKPEWDWDRAKQATLRRIYHGEVPEPEYLAKVEALLAEWFAASCDGETPSESMIREKAAHWIWDVIKAGN